MTSGDRGVCFHLEGQELGRRLLQVPAVLPHQIPGSHGRKLPLSFEDTALKLSVSERSLFFTAKWTSSTFQVLFFSSFIVPVSGTKDKTKYNGTRSCCSHRLAEQGSFRSSGQQPGPTTKCVFLIISQYRTRRNLNLLKAKA